MSIIPLIPRVWPQMNTTIPRHAERVDDQANYNKGFALRKAILGDSATVNCEIPLNRYSSVKHWKINLTAPQYKN